MPNFNVRVYGILIENNSILVSDEVIKGRLITKFVGGGLEFGEGTKDCLIREFKEELNVLIAVEEHVYTTDFFVESAFSKDSQVISIYYKVKLLEELNFEKKMEENQSLRWIKLSDISEDDFTLVIDKYIGKILSRN